MNLFRSILDYFSQKQFRANEESISGIRPTPLFAVGDQVQELVRPGVRGMIRDIGWHYKEKKYFYFIIIGNRKKSRRYFEDELRLIE